MPKDSIYAGFVLCNGRRYVFACVVWHPLSPPTEVIWQPRCCWPSWVLSSRTSWDWLSPRGETSARFPRLPNTSSDFWSPHNELTVCVGMYVSQEQHFPHFKPILDKLVQQVILGLKSIDFAKRFGSGFRKGKAQLSSDPVL